MAAVATAGLSTVSRLARDLARSGGSTSGAASTAAPAPAGGSTAAQGTSGASPGTLPGPATAAAAWSKRTPKDGRSTAARSAALTSRPLVTPGSRLAALELLDGLAAVLTREANSAHDEDVSAELNLLIDGVLDSREAIEEDGLDG